MEANDWRTLAVAVLSDTNFCSEEVFNYHRPMSNNGDSRTFEKQKSTRPKSTVKSEQMRTKVYESQLVQLVKSC